MLALERISVAPGAMIGTIERMMLVPEVQCGQEVSVELGNVLTGSKRLRL